MKLSSVLVYDISGKGFTRLGGASGFKAFPLIQGESVQGRFFVFDQQPSMDRLAPPNPETPLPPGPVLKTASEVVERVYWYALDRAHAGSGGNSRIRPKRPWRRDQSAWESCHLIATLTEAIGAI